MEQKRTGLSYVFTLAKGERGKLGVGMLLEMCIRDSCKRP